MNLANEYMNRRTLKGLSGTNESLLFLENIKNQVDTVCLVSSKNHGLKSCGLCGKGLTLETFYISKASYNVTYHTHIYPDDNLLSHFKNKTPKVIRSEKEIEVYLWAMFARSLAKVAGFEYLSEDNMIESMIALATKNASVYNSYYGIYENIVGRTYLLKG